MQSVYELTGLHDDDPIPIKGLEIDFIMKVPEHERENLRMVFGYFDKAGFLQALSGTLYFRSLEYMPLTHDRLIQWGLLDCSAKFILEKYDQEGYFSFSSFVFSYLEWLNNCQTKIKSTSQGFPWLELHAENTWFKSTMVEHFSYKSFDLLKKDIMFCTSLATFPDIGPPPDGFIWVYHATSWSACLHIELLIITEIDTGWPRDFGVGFYVTTNIDNANLCQLSFFDRQTAILVFALPVTYSETVSQLWLRNIGEWRKFVKKSRSGTNGIETSADVVRGPVCKAVQKVNQGHSPQPLDVEQLCFKAKSSTVGLKLRKIVFLKDNSSNI